MKKPSDDVILAELIELLSNHKAFENLSTQQITGFARRGLKDVRVVPHGETIIQQSGTGDWFFVVMHGEFAAFDSSQEKPRLLNYMNPGIIAGVRALLGDGVRSATVTAVRDSLIVVYGKEDWQWLIQQDAQVETYFREFERRFDDRSLIDFPGRQPDEVVVIASKRHWLALVANFTVPFMILVLPVAFLLFANLLGIPFLAAITDRFAWLILIPSTLIAVLMMLYHYFDWRNDDFIVTTKRVLHIERILFYGIERRESPLTQIQAITVSSHNVVDMFFDVADIQIKTAAVGILKVDTLPAAQNLSRIILEEQQRARERGAAMDVDALRRTLNKQLQKDIMVQAKMNVITPKVIKRGKIPLPQINFDFNYFVPHVRVEAADNSITWRKHYFVLFRYMLAPVSLLLVFLYLILASLFGFFPFHLFTHWALTLFFGLCFLATFGWQSVRYDAWRRDIYVVTDTKIIDVEGTAFKLRGEKRREGSFESIQNITYVIPNFFDQLLNLGDVKIETASADGNFTFKRVFQPSQVQEEIFRRWDRYHQAKRERQRDGNYMQIVEVIAEYHAITNEEHLPHS